MTFAARLAVVGIAVAMVGAMAITGCGDDGDAGGEDAEVATGADDAEGDLATGDDRDDDTGDATGRSGDPSATAEGGPVNEPQVCFEAEALQHLGGKHLAALDAADGDPSVYRDQLEEIVDGPFGASLNNRLYELRASGDSASEAVDAAAQDALERVQEEPGLLLDEDRLEAAFADAQAAAERADFSSPDCGG